MPKSVAAAPIIRDRIKDFRRVRASQLVPNPKNWRLHPEEQRSALRELLSSIGFAGAELVRELPDGRLMLIDGHLRQEEMLEAGDQLVPVLVTDLDEADADALLASYDPIASMARADTQRLDALLESIRESNGAAAALLEQVRDREQEMYERLQQQMHGYGDEDGAVPTREVDDPGGGGDDYDTTPDEQEEPTSRPGQLWRLGEHRLLCGDSTRADVVARLMGKDKVRLVCTDPPYGVGYVGGTQDARSPNYRMGRPVPFDNGTPQDTEDAVADALAAIAPRCATGAASYVLSPGGDNLPHFIVAMNRAGFTFRHTLVWVKDSFVFGRTDYHYQHELILYGWLETGAHYWAGDRTLGSIFEIPRPKRSEEHPTMKPLALIAALITNSTMNGDVVYEPFAGSGTTLIAAHRLGRRCCAMEIDPRYVDVILHRFEVETGIEPVLLSD